MRVSPLMHHRDDEEFGLAVSVKDGVGKASQEYPAHVAVDKPKRLRLIFNQGHDGMTGS
jgi:hypothetical protein